MSDWSNHSGSVGTIKNMSDGSNLSGSASEHFTSDPSVIERMKAWASDPNMSTVLVQDEACLGGLIMVLSNSDQNIVKSALETLFKLAEWPEHRVIMKNFLGMMDQLSKLMSRPCSSVQELAQTVYNLLCHPAQIVPLKDSGNQNKPRSGFHRPKRRNSFFVGGGVGQSKTVVLQIRGINDKDDIELCRQNILTVKGVISITFDLKKKKVPTGTKVDLKPELLARAIAKTMTISADQVIKDDAGNEVLLSFGASSLSMDKENEDLPDYPLDDSPVRAENNLARLDAETPDNKKTWGFVKSVGKFLSKTLYW